MDTSKAQPPPDLGNMTPQVVLETNMGTIVMELDKEKAPKSAESILLHVENGFYDGLMFHRVIPGFMIQAGGFTPDMMQRQSNQPSVQNEATNGLKNARGTIAMARTNDPHSAQAQFFINLVDNGFLDFTSETTPSPGQGGGWGYAVVGHVVEGMDVVDAIAAAPTHTVGRMDDVPVETVIIEKAYVK
jgi:peptidyl-prolyl cis-trans isomerase B (cyclophilin B)